MTDTELLDWAQTHPEAAKRGIDVFWALCGRGCREQEFNYRAALEEAKRIHEEGKR